MPVQATGNAMIFDSFLWSSVPESAERPAGRRRRIRRRDKITAATEADTEDTSASSPEHEAIHLPDIESEDIRRAFSDDHLFKYGTPNPSLPGTEVPCGGCGALLHSRWLLYNSIAIAMSPFFITMFVFFSFLTLVMITVNGSVTELAFFGHIFIFLNY